MADMMLILCFISLAGLINVHLCDTSGDCFSIEDVQKNAGIVEDIIGFIAKNEKGKTYKELYQFIDTFGPRFAGSPNLEKAIDHVVDKLKEDGVEGLVTEKVRVLAWKRGTERLEVISPERKALKVLGRLLGDGPEGAISAPVLVIRNKEQLNQQTEHIKGNIVLFFPDSLLRDADNANVHIALKAHSLGALGYIHQVLRAQFNTSDGLTPDMPIDDLHEQRFPIGCISVLDSQYLWELSTRGQVVVNMTMEGSKTTGAISRNIIAEIRGSASEEQIIISGHMDSVDTSPGAQDNGAGSFVSWRALAVLHKMNLRPKRTLKMVLFTGEEQGLFGSHAYVKRHEDEMANTLLVLNSDKGIYDLSGIAFSGYSRCALEMARAILSLMKPLNVTRVYTFHEDRDVCFSDCSSFIRRNIPCGLLRNADDGPYFKFHHTRVDDMSTLSADQLDIATAFWAALAYVYADIDGDLPLDTYYCN